jgi:hypothetical protein
LGIEQSRRDDLESIGYVLVYFLKGVLPWQGLKAKNAQKKYQLILQKKQQVSVSTLCAGCPAQFAEFLAYTRSLKFDSKPDVPYLRKLFRDLYIAQGYGASSGRTWDWDNYDSDYLSPSSLTAAPVPAEYKDEDDMIVDDGMEEGEGMDFEPVGHVMTGMSGFESRPMTSGGVGSKEDKGAPTWADPYTSNVVTRSQLPAGGSPQRRPHSANLPPQKATDPHMVAGARAMMRYRRTSRGSEVMPPSSPTSAPKIIFQNPAKQPVVQAPVRRASPDGAHSGGGMPWASNERASKASGGSAGGVSSTRGILKSDNGWIPSAAAQPVREEEPSNTVLGIGKQFVTKVKASSLFNISR